MNKCNIAVTQLNEKKISDFIKLSEVEYGNLETVTSLSHLKWKHLNSPFGASTAINLEDEGKTVGRIVLQPREFYVKGRIHKTAFVTDALVHPDYRRPISNFLTLMQSIRKVKDFSIIFHSSNEKTEGIYSKILKFSCPFFLGGYGFPLRLSNLISGKGSLITLFLKAANIVYKPILHSALKFFLIFNKIKLSQEGPKNNIFDEFCRDKSLENGLLTLRDEATLNWRFKDAPLWSADILHLYKNNQYLGYVALRNLCLNDVNFSVIMDFIIDSKLSKVQTFFLRLLLMKKAISNGSDIIFSLLNPKSKLSKKFLGFPFVNVPDKLLPHSTPIFVHALDPDLISMEKELGLHITLADIDYF